MTARREFTRKQRGQIICRATNPKTGKLECEGCGLVLGLKRYEIDHKTAEAFVTDKSAPLTIEDGWLLGVDCCHKPKTADDIRRIRKADRQRDKHTGAVKPAARPIPGSRASGIRKRMSGQVERWT